MKKTKRILILASIMALLLTGCQAQTTETPGASQPTKDGAVIAFTECQVPAVVLEIDGNVIKIVFSNPSTNPNGGVSTGLSGAAVPSEIITGLNQEVIPPEVLTALSKTGANATLTIANESILKDCTLADIKVGNTLLITFDANGSITEIGLAYTKNANTVQ